MSSLQADLVLRKLRRLVGDEAADSLLAETMESVHLQEITSPEDRLLVGRALVARGGAFGAVGQAICSQATLHSTHRPATRARSELDAGFLAAVVGSTAMSVVSWAPDGTVLSWNPGAEKLYGYDAGEMIGLNISKIVPDERREELATVFEALREGTPTTGLETIRTRKDGSLVHVALTVSPVVDPGGLLLGASVLSHDIGARVEAERARDRLLARLRRSNRDLGQFAYVAAHDLQEPLRMIASYTQLFAQRYDAQIDERADKYIRYIVEGAKRMQDLLNGLLAYSRVGQNQRVRLVESARVAAAAVRNLTAAIDESGAEVTVGPLPAVHVDGTQLTAVFQNLIGNAIKFVPASRSPRVRVDAVRQDDDWVFSVEDNGVGIEAGLGDRIFTMFQRGHARSKFPGNGIGLALAKKILERHGGALWTTPNPEIGTTFFFSLPASPPATEKSYDESD